MAENLLILLKGVRSNSRKLAAGDTLFRRGEPANAVFHVEHGRIRLSQNGVTVHRAEAGQPFAENALFSDIADSDAVAEIASQIRAFPKAAILLLLKAHPDLNLAFSAYLTRQLQRQRSRTEVLRQRGAGDRVLSYLAQAGAGGATVSLDQPLTEIATEIGLTREALYRTLTRLEKEGRLSREGTRTFRLV